MKNILSLLACLAFVVAGCGDDEPREPSPSELCQEIDCSGHGTCNPNNGEPFCSCNEGYATSEDGLSCNDVDECATDNGGCGPDYRFICQNNEGAAPTCSDRCDNLEASFEVVEEPAAEPPQSGTVWFSADILTDDDPTAFLSLSAKGQADRVMYDRRTESFETFNAHLFDATFGADTVVEIQVNPEFSAEEAEAEAQFYAPYIGKLPGFLFADLETVWIHKGLFPFGGGNNNLLIHTEQGQSYLRDGVLEEVFIHEGAHTSMDAYHGNAPAWVAAQEADGLAISTYAQDNPQREDIAESLGPYLGYRFRAERLSLEQMNMVETTIPNRVLYFDCLEIDIAPLSVPR